MGQVIGVMPSFYSTKGLGATFLSSWHDFRGEGGKSLLSE